MGVVYTFLLPLILAMAAVAFATPFIAVVCLMAAVGCAVVVFWPARKMVRGNSSGMRAAGILTIIFLGLATIALIAVAVVAAITAVYFYGSILSA